MVVFVEGCILIMSSAVQFLPCIIVVTLISLSSPGIFTYGDILINLFFFFKKKMLIENITHILKGHLTVFPQSVCSKTCRCKWGLYITTYISRDKQKWIMLYILFCTLLSLLCLYCRYSSMSVHSGCWVFFFLKPVVFLVGMPYHIYPSPAW